MLSWHFSCCKFWTEPLIVITIIIIIIKYWKVNTDDQHPLETCICFLSLSISAFGLHENANQS